MMELRFFMRYNFVIQKRISVIQNGAARFLQRLLYSILSPSRLGGIQHLNDASK